MSSKKYYDAKTRPISIHVGDKVLLRNAARVNKFSSHWQGPYVIEAINSKVNATIIIGKRKRRVHFNRLKLFHVFKK